MGHFVVLLLLAPPAWCRHINEGSAVVEIAQTTEAVGALDREISNPRTSAERLEAAKSERQAGVEHVSTIASSFPQNAAINAAASAGLLKVQEPARAEIAADRVVASAPANPDGYLLRGRARMEMQRYDEAVKDFEATLRLRPDDPVATAGLRLSLGRSSGGVTSTRARRILLNAIVSSAVSSR